MKSKSKQEKMNTPDEILLTALEKEKEAYNFYSALAKKSKFTVVTELVEKLKDEEQKHVKLIENMLAKLYSGHRIVD